MSKSPAASPRSRFYPAMLLVLACAVVAFSAWSASSSPAMASILNLGNPPTATHSQSFAFASIAKPSYTNTATATQFPTAIPTQTLEPTPTPGAIFAEIVPDTPAPEFGGYVAPPQEQAAVSYGGNKYILVDISEQHMYVYEGEVLVYSFVASTGMRNATRVGTFSVLEKIPNAYGATWNIWMPNWLGIYWAGGLQNGIHALPILPSGAQLWEGYLGTPISYGCVVLGAYESQLLYDWAEIGTPVEIQR
jgi:lipoprotein-anchoring transpeptidase ErfK/SrfK